MDTKMLTFRTIIKKDGRYYHGFVPSLPGCHTQGKTIEEARENLRDAIEGYLISLKKHGEPIPQDEGFETTEIIDLNKLFEGSSYA